DPGPQWGRRGARGHPPARRGVHRRRRRRGPPSHPRRRVPRAHREARGGRQDAPCPGEERPMTVHATTASSGGAAAAVRHAVPTGPRWILPDAWVEAMRHLRVIPRNIELLIFAAIQPVMFVLLFVYVFGGAIAAPPGFSDYEQ